MKLGRLWLGRCVLALVLALTMASCQRPGAQPPARAEAQGALFPVARDGRWGFVDVTGRLVLPLRFEYAEPFSEGLSLVLEGHERLFIDTSGRVATRLPSPYNVAEAFSGGLALIGNAPFRVTSHLKEYNYLDFNGRLLFPEGTQPFHEAKSFADGMAAVGVHGEDMWDIHWGFIDRAGRLAIPPRFSGVGDFSEGLAPAADEELRWGFIDKSGNWVVPPQFESLEPLHEGRAVARLPDERYGFIDRSGQFVIPPRYHDVRAYSEGLAAFAGAQGGWGLIDLQGQVQVSPRFEFVGPFVNGRAPAELDGKWGYIDRQGAWVVEPQFVTAQPFQSGLGRIQRNGDCCYNPGDQGYVDVTGRVVWAPSH